MRNIILALVALGHCLWLAQVKAELFVIPQSPGLSPAGRNLVYFYEVGGREGYNPRIEYGGGDYSGPTIGIGYDLGYNSRNAILHDWRRLPAPILTRLAGAAGYTGDRGRAKVKELRDILIQWGYAEETFNEVTVNKFWQLCQRTYPGFDNLRPNAQAALWSLTYNRGNSLAGPGRVEMREITRLSPRKDYNGMAQQIRLMKRLWRGKGLDGLLRRREAEATLMEG